MPQFFTVSHLTRILTRQDALGAPVPRWRVRNAEGMRLTRKGETVRLSRRERGEGWTLSFFCIGFGSAAL